VDSNKNPVFKMEEGILVSSGSDNDDDEVKSLLNTTIGNDVPNER
jgi:hypothetical protein